MHSGFVAVAGRHNGTGLAGLHLQDGANGGIDFGVHENHWLAVFDRLQDPLRAELDRASHVDHDIDLAGAADRDRRKVSKLKRARDRIANRYTSPDCEISRAMHSQ